MAKTTIIPITAISVIPASPFLIVGIVVVVIFVGLPIRPIGVSRTRRPGNRDVGKTRYISRPAAIRKSGCGETRRETPRRRARRCGLCVAIKRQYVFEPEVHILKDRLFFRDTYQSKSAGENVVKPLACRHDVWQIHLALFDEVRRVVVSELACDHPDIFILRFRRRLYEEKPLFGELRQVLDRLDDDLLLPFDGDQISRDVGRDSLRTDKIGRHQRLVEIDLRVGCKTFADHVEPETFLAGKDGRRPEPRYQERIRSRGWRGFGRRRRNVRRRAIWITRRRFMKSKNVAARFGSAIRARPVVDRRSGVFEILVVASRHLKLPRGNRLRCDRLRRRSYRNVCRGTAGKNSRAESERKSQHGKRAEQDCGDQLVSFRRRFAFEQVHFYCTASSPAGTKFGRLKYAAISSRRLTVSPCVLPCGI